MAIVVPQADGGFGQVVFIAQGAQAGCAQEQEAACRRLKPKPARGENPQEMPAREDQDVTLESPEQPHDAIGPRPHLPRGFTPGATVTKQFPVGPFSVNLNAAAAFVVTVVPFEQITFDLGHPPKPGQLTSSGRTL